MSDARIKKGDLVKRKGENWIGVVIEMVKSGNYTYPKLIWVDEDNSFSRVGRDRIDSCSSTLLEVISEA